MVKRILKSNRWFLALIILLSLYLVALYFRMKSAEIMVAEYGQSKVCSITTNCRTTVSVTILESKTYRFSFVNYGSKGIRTISGTFLKYSFNVFVSDLKTQTVEVLPNTPSSLDGFDVENIYIPTKSNKSFIQDNFYNGKVVFVEIWHDQITFLIVDSIIDNPDFTVNANNTTESQIQSSIGPVEPKTYKIFIPTSNHPLVGLESARSEFYGWGVVLVGTMGFVMVGIFSDIEKTRTARKRKHDTTN